MFERIYPTKVILPMKMHYGVPAVPTVKVGDYVRMGQCVGVPEKGSFSVPVHSGISGKVTDISDIRLPNGILTPAVTIKNDMKRARLDSVRPRSGFKLSATEAIGVIRDAGICGMGGAYVSLINGGGVWNNGCVNGQGWIAVALVIFAAWPGGIG